MAAYGYIRTSRDRDPGHPGSDPEVQRRQLADAGVERGLIYADVAVSGAKASTEASGNSKRDSINHRTGVPTRPAARSSAFIHSLMTEAHCITCPGCAIMDTSRPVTDRQ